jgi:iron complex outermembrane receptor protein
VNWPANELMDFSHWRSRAFQAMRYPLHIFLIAPGPRTRVASESLMSRLRTAVYLTILIWQFAWDSPVRAATDGGIRGTVQDQSGGIVPGAAITVTNIRTGAMARVTTDSNGSFAVARLQPGEYRVHAELLGFRSAGAQVTVADGATETVDLSLSIAPVSETVTVTRSGQTLTTVPDAVTVIDGDKIQFAQRRVNPAEALADVPGLLAENRHNFSLSGGVRLAIRAPLPTTGMRGVQIVQDGIPITTADGTTQPTNLALGSAGRAEIIRGPSSVLYGNAAGGVISLFTEFPSADRLNLQPDVQFGSYGYRRQQVKAEGTVGRFGYLVDANRMTTDGYRTHSGADVRQANMVVRMAMSPVTEIRGVFNLFDMPFGESASGLARADALNNPRSVRQLAIEQGWGESSQQGQGGLTIQHQFAGGRQLSATGWAMWRTAWNPIPFRIIDLGRSGAGFRSEYRGSEQIGTLPLNWIVGFDMSYQHDKRHEFENIGVPDIGSMTREGALVLDQLEQVLSAAPFAEVGVSLRPRWRLTAGVRYDWYRFKAADYFRQDADQSGQRIMNAGSPKIGLTWAAADDLNLYTNFSTAYQTPTTMELSNRPTGEGGFNQDLNPATLKSFEVGARGLFPRLRLRYELAGYVSALDDAFVSFQRADEQTFFRNAGRSRRDGAEALLSWAPSPRLDTKLAYTYQNFRFDRFVTAQADYSGKREPGAPPHLLFVSGTYNAPFGVRSTARVRWMDAYPVDNANTTSNWASHVVDLRFALDRVWKGLSWRPFVGIDNVLNERYNASTTPNAVGGRYFEPAPDREIYVGLTLGARLM